MKMQRYNFNRIGSEISATYGVVNDEGTNALRVHADDYGDRTIFSCRAGYRGQGLAFEDDMINDAGVGGGYLVPDNARRRLTLEVTPPLSDLHLREHVVGIFATALFAEDGPLLDGFCDVPGNIRIGLEAG